MKGWGPGHLPNRHEALVLNPAKRQKRKKEKEKKKTKKNKTKTTYGAGELARLNCLPWLENTKT